MIDLFISYGHAALVWVLTAVGALIGAHVIARLRAGYVRDVLSRAWDEVKGAVIEVEQTYTDELRRGRADGILTDAERAEAKAKAIWIARSNLGARGLARLERVLGFDPGAWLASRTEQAVKAVKAAAPTPPGPPRPA